MERTYKYLERLVIDIIMESKYKYLETIIKDIIMELTYKNLENYNRYQYGTYVQIFREM
jgi:hypothetical protein